jgi:hypothetical protein
MASDDAAGRGILLAPQEALGLRLGILGRIDFHELGADRLTVDRDDLGPVREWTGPGAELGEGIVQGPLEQR